MSFSKTTKSSQFCDRPSVRPGPKNQNLRTLKKKLSTFGTLLLQTYLENLKNLGRRHNRQAGLTARKVAQAPLRGGLGFRVGRSKAAAEKPTSKLTLAVSKNNMFDRNYEGRIVQFMEYVKGFNLFELAKERADLLTPDFIKNVMTQIIKGVELNYIYEYFVIKKIISHNDLKPENIMVEFPHGNPNNPVVKIVDYDLCTVREYA